VDTIVRGAAATALGNLANAYQPDLVILKLVEMLAMESDAKGQELAEAALRTLPPTSSATFALLEVVQDSAKPTESRKWAAQKLAQLIVKVPEQQLNFIRDFTGLIAIIKDKESDSELRENAAKTLSTLFGAVPQKRIAKSAAMDRASMDLASILRDQSDDLSVRSHTSRALAQLFARAPNPTKELPTPTKELEDLLKSLDQEEKRSSVFKGFMVDVLISHLNKADSKDLKRLAELLATIGQPAIEALSVELKKNQVEDESDRKKAQIRSRIVNAQGEFRKVDNPKLAIPELIAVLTDKKHDISLRIAAAEGLASLGKGIDRDATIDDERAKEVVTLTTEKLLLVVEDDSYDSFVRESASRAFDSLPQTRIVDALVSIMTKSTESKSRQAAEHALTKLDAKVALPYLLDNPKLDPKAETEEAKNQSWKIALVLATIVKGDEGRLPPVERKRAIDRLEQVHELDVGTSGEQDELATTIGELRDAQFNYNILVFLVGLAAYVVLCLCIWGIVYQRDPLVILRFNRFMSKYPALRSVCRPLLFVWVFEYRDRVIDAWVAQHVQSARKAFGELPTVQDRSIHVPTPVEFDPVNGRKSTLPELSPQSLRETFGQNPTRLLLLADGGSGKTSTACQIAKWAMSASASENLGGHRMLPVLIEQELGDDSFRGTILKRLADLIGDEVPPQLFEHLLSRQRLLVIFDRFSEMSDETQENVIDALSNNAGSSIGSLLVTSRNKKELEVCEWTVVEPLFIKGNQLSSFMEGYLAKRETRGLFDDAEFFDLCRRLSLMVGEREITALFGKLYAEQLISTKSERTDAIVSGPDSIPNLMKTHLKGLHKQQADPPFRIDRVQRASEKIAWVCLRKSFRPGTVTWELALEALSNDNQLLEYLVDDRGSQSEPSAMGESMVPGSSRQIGLIQRVGEHKNHVRFILDPMAEYLAGLHLVETEIRNDQGQWLDFLKDAEENNPEKIKGFLLAVRDCCLAAEVDVPDHVPHELAKLAGLNIHEIEQHQREQRIRRNVANLDLPAAEDRIAAAEALGNIGTEAEKAVPVLIRSLRDKDWRVRAASAEGLAKIGSSPGEIVPELGRVLEDEKQDHVLQVLVKALGEFRGDSKEFVPQLCSKLHTRDNKNVRQAAATALGKIGKAAKEVTPELIKVLSDDDWDVAESATKALGQIGAGAVKNLIEVMEHDDELVRWRAAEALAAIGPAAQDAVPALIRALTDEDWGVRKSAAFAIGSIGPATEDAMNALKKTRNDDPEESVVESAAKALQSIRSIVA
jgi:HEAT repeat protein